MLYEVVLYIFCKYLKIGTAVLRVTAYNAKMTKKVREILKRNTKSN